MSMMRWQPFPELISLRQAMEKLFEDSFVTPSRILSTLGPSVATPIDMCQTANDVIVKAALSSHSLVSTLPQPGQKYPETGLISWQWLPRLLSPDSDKNIN